MVTMIIIGVFGCFRIGEICGRTENKHRDLITSEDGVHITLWRTKTDKENKGITKFIANLRDSFINPVNLIRGLQIARRVAINPGDPFFVNSSGKLATHL